MERLASRSVHRWKNHWGAAYTADPDEMVLTVGHLEVFLADYLQNRRVAASSPMTCSEG